MKINVSWKLYKLYWDKEIIYCQYCMFCVKYFEFKLILIHLTVSKFINTIAIAVYQLFLYNKRFEKKPTEFKNALDNVLFLRWQAFFVLVLSFRKTTFYLFWQIMTDTSVLIVIVFRFHFNSSILNTFLQAIYMVDYFGLLQTSCRKV